MILVLILVLLLLTPLAILFRSAYRFRNRTINDVKPFLRRISLRELESLLDSRDEQTLEQNLTVSQFAKAQLRRIHLFREKLRCADHNAFVLQQWAAYELDRTYVTHNAEVKENATGLLEVSRDFRIAAFWIKIQLNLWHIKLTFLPVRSIPWISALRMIDSFDLLHCYNQLTERAAALARSCGENCRLSPADLL